MTGVIRTGKRMGPHLIAIAGSMAYAWYISHTAYVTTGLQFIAPLLIILLCHIVVLAVQGRLIAGYAGQVLKKSVGTSVLLFGLILASEILSPHPSHAAEGALEGLLGVLFCLVVLAVALAIAAGLIYVLWLACAAAYRAITGKSKDDGMHDFASVAFAGALIAGASFEGVPGAYSFSGTGSATASYQTQASPTDIWAAMQTATAPEFPLPAVLDMFPRPIAVLVDEGTVLGANRVVLFKGREGQGKLHLRVVSQTGTDAMFEVVSNTSPIAKWVKLDSLSYSVVDGPDGARLDVRFDYERLLAPAWIFDPMVENAVYLAASVLAHDTITRAETLNRLASVSRTER